MSIGKILMLDDEEGATSDYRYALRRAGVQVVAFTNIDKAYEAIKESIKDGVKQENKFDFILLDIMISGQKIPSDLKSYHDNLSSQVNNEGQALGQWLWEYGGGHVNAGQPMHCYFSNVPSIYSFSKDLVRQEFFLEGDFNVDEQKKIREIFVLNKLEISPSQLKNALERVKGNWISKKLIK